MARVMLFARRPRAGRVKTRLAREIGAPSALRLYRAFLADQLALLDRLGGLHAVELWLDGPWQPEIDGPLPAVPVRDQRQGDLGARLARGVTAAALDADLPAVLLGADAPSLPCERIERAIERLVAPGTIDAVVEPADDGGYVMLALRQAQPTLFERVPWGGPEVLRVTLDRARAAGIRLHVGRGWYDVDDRRGLARLREDLAHAAARARAPRTASVLDDLDRACDGVV